MDMRAYQYFIAIAEEKSISKAAKRLYITQPALTQFLHNLEESLDTRLFERIENQYIPTTAGSIYLKGAYSIVAINRETQNRIHESKSGNIFDFTIALSHSQNVHRIHYLFLKMKERFPNIRFHVLERTSEQCPEAVSSGLADIGIISQPTNRRNISCIPLWDDYPLLVTNRGLLDRVSRNTTGSPFPVVRLTDLVEKTFISMTRSSHAWQACDELFQQYAMKPNIVFECPFVSSLMHILENTQDYIAIVPMGLLNANPAFSYYCIEDAATWSVMAIHRSNMPLMMHHEYFIDVMKRAPLLHSI